MKHGSEKRPSSLRTILGDIPIMIIQHLDLQRGAYAASSSSKYSAAVVFICTKSVSQAMGSLCVMARKNEEGEAWLGWSRAVVMRRQESAAHVVSSGEDHVFSQANHFDGQGLFVINHPQYHLSNPDYLQSPRPPSLKSSPLLSSPLLSTLTCTNPNVSCHPPLCTIIHHEAEAKRNSCLSCQSYQILSVVVSCRYNVVKSSKTLFSRNAADMKSFYRKSRN